MNLLISIVAGVLVGVIIGKITEYYPPPRPARSTPSPTSRDRRRANIIAGLAVGMRSVALSVLLICVAIFVANWAGTPAEGGVGYGVYCAALAAVACSRPSASRWASTPTARWPTTPAAC